MVAITTVLVSGKEEERETARQLVWLWPGQKCREGLKVNATQVWWNNIVTNTPVPSLYPYGRREGLNTRSSTVR